MSQFDSDITSRGGPSDLLKGPSVSKRSFLQGAAASVGFVALSKASRAIAAQAYATETYDIIVVGAGTAGMPLAISAADRGAKVLVIEKSGQIGGTLYLSGGHVAAAGTKLQKRLGIHDTPDMHYDDVMRLSNDKADTAIVRHFVDNAAPTMDWLEDMGFQAKDGDPVKGEAHASFNTARYYQGPEFGRSLLKTMWPYFDKAVASGNVKVLLWTGASELIIKQDKSIAGVIAEDSEGKRTQYMGRSVVLTAGGTTANIKRFLELTGKHIYGRGTYAYSQGQGIDLGISAGGVVRGGEHQVLGGGIVMDRNYPSPPIPGSGTESARTYGTSVGTDPRRRLPWEIQVNMHGDRFMPEDSLDIDLTQRAFTNQPTQRAWVIYDQEIYEKSPELMQGKTPAEVVQLFDLHPMFFRAASIEELAYKMNMPPTNLVATITKYNASVASKADAFGRQHMPLPIKRGPFYGIELSGGTVVGFAGLTVDKDMRVLDKNGAAIHNLYAAGEIIGLAATCGNTVVSGGSVTPALVFGRLLGSRILPVRNA